DRARAGDQAGQGAARIADIAAGRARIVPEDLAVIDAFLRTAGPEIRLPQLGPARIELPARRVADVEVVAHPVHRVEPGLAVGEPPGHEVARPGQEVGRTRIVPTGHPAQHHPAEIDLPGHGV